MPWVTLVIMLISYFLSRKSGMSKGKSALIAGAAGLATYATIDPANERALFLKNRVSEDAKDNGLSMTTDPQGETLSSGVVKTVGDLGTAAITSTADVAKEWGPLGTAGAVTAISNRKQIGSFFKDNPWLMYAALALLAIFLLK